eukprot:scaffold9758_cov96-Isochrysis_galbana.AAC.1
MRVEGLCWGSAWKHSDPSLPSRCHCPAQSRRPVARGGVRRRSLCRPGPQRVGARRSAWGVSACWAWGRPGRA